ncbi:MAG: HAD-IA family hydrolase [Flaviflexus sp.]|nr:HAD-IA family hydrolase [Flaviflexus sp.]
MRPAAVLFDLDGTIIDSAPIVTRIMSEVASELFGVDEDLDYFQRFVGPPLSETMAELGASEDEVPAAIAYFRERYGKVMTDSPPFAGMPELLASLTMPIAVATSKKEEAAKRVLAHHGLIDHFTVVSGSRSEGEPKSEIVGTALAELRRVAGPIDGEILMIGDRIHDIEAARAHGLDTILVTWGAGRAGEAEQARQAVDTVADLAELL